MRAELVHRLLVPVAVVLWVAAAVLAATFLSWWLALLLLIAVLALSPSAVRTQRRRLRMHQVAEGVAAAGWAELLDRSADHGVPMPRDRSVRETATLFSTAHRLDDTGRAGLWIVVEALERDWYAPEHTSASAPDTLHQATLSALDAVGRGSLRQRCWPRSVIGGRTRGPATSPVVKEHSTHT